MGTQIQIFHTPNFIDFGVLRAVLGPTNDDFCPVAISMMPLTRNVVTFVKRTAVAYGQGLASLTIFGK